MATLNPPRNPSVSSPFGFKMAISLLPRFFFFFILSAVGSITNFTQADKKCLNGEKALLLELKHDLIFHSSISTKLVRWNQTGNCCSWDGVECDGSGRVIGLHLDHEGIRGATENSSSLFGLRYLEKLNLAYNNLDSIQVTRWMRNLTYLTHLNLSNAVYNGEIPVEISFLRRLVSLDISFLYLAVEPQRQCRNFGLLVQNLSSLRELYLDYVDISANGSEWCRIISSSLPELRNLSLRSCNLSGPLDPSLSRLHHLSILRLDSNNISTPVPSFFSNFSSLTILSLSDCSLYGSFPDAIFQIPTLQSLDLSGNSLLSGTVTKFPVSGSFQTIMLSWTNFSGTLPDSIGNLKMLSNIELSNCKFTGPIPPALANLTELSRIDLSGNFFTGSIPSFHMSKKLTYIDLGSNDLTRALSSTTFEGLSDLVYVNLGNNSLNGSIPESLFILPLLQTLLLYNNQFSGRVDEFSFSAPNLYNLDLRNNRLGGPIPESFFQLESLESLYLSNNFFDGSFQLAKIQRLHNLTILDLSYNNLSVDASSTSSTFPIFPRLTGLILASCNLQNFSYLINQPNLLWLDLSNNRISGKIPNWIWEIGNGQLVYLNISGNLLVDLQKPYNISSSVRYLDLHSNQLRAEVPLPPEAVYVDYSDNHFEKSIPLNIGNYLTNCFFLSFAKNSLSGSIPTSLCNATSLGVLELSVNNLSGNIPPCLLENMEYLEVLNLARNNISGDIPDKFLANCGLKTLDVSKNNLGGNIPVSIANCKRLEVMNVGNNDIDDSFPCMLPSSLSVLVLRSNRFHGEVRCNTSWPNLQILDIASNNFGGYLYPRSFSSWRWMTLDTGGKSRNSPLGVNYILMPEGTYYQDEVTLTIKGLELHLVKIWGYFSSIDFSCNNFIGEIPDVIGNLSSLYLLNLSHNALKGKIPTSFGKLKQLGSLDLSGNMLSGTIPMELSQLTLLSVLNLSFNKLVGTIPTGPQFQTFPASTFEGNAGLCGLPLNTSCNNFDENNTQPAPQGKTEIEWDYVSAALGYVVGLGSFVWLLLCCRSLRRKLFEKIDEVLEKIFGRRDRGRRTGRGAQMRQNNVRRR